MTTKTTKTKTLSEEDIKIFELRLLKIAINESVDLSEFKKEIDRFFEPYTKSVSKLYDKLSRNVPEGGSVLQTAFLNAADLELYCDYTELNLQVKILAQAYVGLLLSVQESLNFLLRYLSDDPFPQSSKDQQTPGETKNFSGWSVPFGKFYGWPRFDELTGEELTHERARLLPRIKAIYALIPKCEYPAINKQFLEKIPHEDDDYEI